MKRRLAALPAAEAAQKSMRIREKLFSLGPFKNAHCVVFFASIAGEVDTAPMIDAAIHSGKRVVLPRYDRARGELFFHEVKDRASDLEPGALGIPEPKAGRETAAEEMDCVIVPGLAFDKAKNRLGRGAGCYDRFLAKLGPRTAKIGLAFAFQVLEKIPVGVHDRSLDDVVTD